MRRLLHGHKSRSVVVLHGLGGIGKTQLAIKYTTRHKENYTAVFWLNANDEDSLKSSFRDIAQHILEEQKGKPFCWKEPTRISTPGSRTSGL
jgi:ATP/maltotriose-dependent transcriptional regulator MalT